MFKQCSVAICAAFFALPLCGADKPTGEKIEELDKSASFVVTVLDDIFLECDIGICLDQYSRAIRIDSIYGLLANHIRDKKLLMFKRELAPDSRNPTEMGDRFRIIIMPHLIMSGFDRIVFAAGDFIYDTDADPIIGERMRDHAKFLAESEEGSAPKKSVEYVDEYMHCRLPKGDSGDANDSMNKTGWLSLDKLREMGERGDFHAYEMYALGLMGLIKGVEGHADIEKGMEILNVLAERNHIPAIKTLGTIYALGALEDGEPRDEKYLKFKYGDYWHFIKYADKEKAYAMLRKAMDLGNSDLWHKLFDMLASDGKTEEMEAWYNKFKNAEDESCNGMVPAMAMAYFGYSISEMSMGCMGYGMAYVPNFGNIKEIRNPQRAWEWARKFSGGGFLQVHMLLDGIGAGKDAKAATELVQKMYYYSNIMECAAYLGYAYANGIGVEKDESKAGLYWEKFFEFKGHESGYAVVDAAKRFYNGFGYPKDKAAAIWILETAAWNPENDYAEYPAAALLKIYEGAFDPADRDDENAKFCRERLDDIRNPDKDGE